MLAFRREGLVGMLRFRILGTLTVEEDVSCSPLAGQSAVSFSGCCSLAPVRLVPVDTLFEVLWGEDPDTVMSRDITRWAGQDSNLRHEG
jgi:hypothetical protein